MNLAFSDWLMMTKTPIVLYNSLHKGPALGSWGEYLTCLSLPLNCISLP